ncbi:MAG: hypothetical protein Q7S02_03825 [bacterium]|nr:hypothetical protein [bacterium]
MDAGWRIACIALALTSCVIDASDPTDGGGESAPVDLEPLDPNAAHVCWQILPRQPQVIVRSDAPPKFSFPPIFSFDTYEAVDDIPGTPGDPHCPPAHYFHGDIPYHGTPDNPHVAMFEVTASAFTPDYFCRILDPGVRMTITSYHDRAPRDGALRFRSPSYALTADAPDADLRDELVRLVPDGDTWAEEPVTDLHGITFRIDGCDGRLIIDGYTLHALPPEIDEPAADPDVRTCRTIAYDGTFATSTGTPLWFSEPGFGWAIVCAHWTLSSD